MALRETLERQGNWLFKWRSYLPLVTIPVILIALVNSKNIEHNFGILANNLWMVFCVSVSSLGLIVRCLTAGYVPRGTSGRNTQSQAASTLNTTGMYSIARNPLYLGNFLMVFGMVLFSQALWLILIVCFGFWIYYERIIFAEEEFLRKKFADAYLKWADKTPAFFPKLSGWQKPALPFSIKTVLRREHSTFISIIAYFTFLNILSDLIVNKKFRVSAAWAVAFACGLTIYFILLILKKKTKMLDVEGR